MQEHIGETKCRFGSICALKRKALLFEKKILLCWSMLGEQTTKLPPVSPTLVLNFRTTLRSVTRMYSAHSNPHQSHNFYVLTEVI